MLVIHVFIGRLLYKVMLSSLLQGFFLGLSLILAVGAQNVFVLKQSQSMGGVIDTYWLGDVGDSG